jgi:hypothetical protein
MVSVSYDVSNGDLRPIADFNALGECYAILGLTGR